MKITARAPLGMALGLVIAAAGCTTQPSAQSEYTIQKITPSRSRGDQSVRVQLSTTGTLAEADAALLVDLVQIVAKRQATKRQAQIAQARAQSAHRRVSARRGTKRHGVRYLAVETEKSAAAPKAAKRSVMLWDVEAEQIVGNNVYDIATVPRPNSLARFETFSASYVAAGN